MLKKIRNLMSKNSDEDTKTRLGAILTMLCAVDEDALQRAYDCQQRHPQLKIGDILVDHGAISEADLEEALLLQDQLRNGKPAVAMSTISQRVLDRRPPARRQDKLAPA